MKYPTFRINGKKEQTNKYLFDWLYKQIKSSITMDNQENELGLSKKDIELLSWNSATMAYHRDLDFIGDKAGDISMMIETSLGYIEMNKNKEAIHHLEIAQKMLRKL